MNNCAYKMRAIRIQSDAKNLLFDCLLHQLGCCYAHSLQARSLRSNYHARESTFIYYPNLFFQHCILVETSFGTRQKSHDFGRAPIDAFYLHEYLYMYFVYALLFVICSHRTYQIYYCVNGNEHAI